MTLTSALLRIITCKTLYCLLSVDQGGNVLCRWSENDCNCVFCTVCKVRLWSWGGRGKRITQETFQRNRIQPSRNGQKIKNVNYRTSLGNFQNTSLKWSPTTGGLLIGMITITWELLLTKNVAFTNQGLSLKLQGVRMYSKKRFKSSLNYLNVFYKSCNRLLLTLKKENFATANPYGPNEWRNRTFICRNKNETVKLRLNQDRGFNLESCCDMFCLSFDGFRGKLT